MEFHSVSIDCHSGLCCIRHSIIVPDLLQPTQEVTSHVICQSLLMGKGFHKDMNTRRWGSWGHLRACRLHPSTEDLGQVKGWAPWLNISNPGKGEVQGPAEEDVLPQFSVSRGSRWLAPRQQTERVLKPSSVLQPQGNTPWLIPALGQARGPVPRSPLWKGPSAQFPGKCKEFTKSPSEEHWFSSHKRFSLALLCQMDFLLSCFLCSLESQDKNEIWLSVSSLTDIGLNNYKNTP